MATKHGAEDQDPDYQDSNTPRKRQRFLEEGAKEATIKKIESIIKHQFSVEMKNKEKEIELIDQRVHQVRAMMDRLRACVVATYYGMPGQPADGEKQAAISEKSGLHPAVKKLLGQSSSNSTSSVSMETESIATSEVQQEDKEEAQTDTSITIETKPSGAKGPRNIGHDTFGVTAPPVVNIPDMAGDESSRFHVKKRIVVGNISKYIAPDKREENDPSTHKWMVYVRGPLEEPCIDHFVKKVWFFLHPSYRPNDLVEVSEPPFHLTRRGWGEFPVRVQLHFVDQRNKKVDIIHNLKLDRTYTGLQTLGAETVVDVELDRYSVEERGTTQTKCKTLQIDKMDTTEDHTVSHSQSQDSKTIEDLSAQDSTVESSAKPPTPIQIAERITAAQQLCLSKIKTQIPTKVQTPSSTTESQSQSILNGSKVIIKATTTGVSTATGTLSMPPLGPIGSAKTSITSTASLTATSGCNTNTLVQLQKMTTQRQAATSGSFVMLTSQTPSQSSNSASVATAMSGAMTTKVRINQGKVEMPEQPTNTPGIKTELNVPQVVSQSLNVSKLTSAVQTPKPTATMATRLPAPSLSTIKTQSSVVTTATPRPQGQTPVAMPTAIAMPAGVTMTAPGVAMGTQYFIAAKSTDPNLQGKMILIPHQALVQATGQRLVAPVAQPITAQSVRPRGSTTTVQRVTNPSHVTGGKVTTTIQRVTTPTQPAKVQSPQVRGQTAQAKGQTVQVRGAFPIPPGNVILIPQGANIPGIQPGSIVQIQQTVPVSKQQTSATTKTTLTTRATGTSSPAVTKTTVQLTPAATVPAGMTAVPVLGTPPTVSKTTVQLTPSAAVQAGLTAVPVIGTQATSLMKTAIQVPAGSQLQSGVSTVTIRPSMATMTSQQNVRSVPSTSTTIPQQSLLSMPSTSTRTILTHAGSKAVQPTKLLVTQPATHAPIKTGVTTSVMREIKGSSVKEEKPETIKITKSVSLLKPLTSLATVVKPGTSKLTLVSPQPQIVTKVTKPVTTIIGPRLPVNVAERRIKEGCLATSKTINLNNINTVEDIVHALVKRNPLIKKERVVHEAPFCASSAEQYKSWLLGKQRAAEWQRATRLRKTLNEIIKMSNKWTESDTWTTKQVVLWCRKHGFSVPDHIYNICEVCGEIKSEEMTQETAEKTPTKEVKWVVGDEDDDNDSEEEENDGEDNDEESEGEEEEQDDDDEEENAEHHECKMTWLNEDGTIAKPTLTTPKTVLDEVDKMKDEFQTCDSDDEIELDVVSITDNKITVKKETMETNDTIQMYLPATLHSEYIQNACQEIGVKLPPVEVTKDTHAPVLEEMLLTAMLEFMNDLMRDSLAVAHGNRTDNRCPSEILPVHVYQSILNQSKYEFLTNKHLGVDVMEMNTSDCSSLK